MTTTKTTKAAKAETPTIQKTTPKLSASIEKILRRFCDPEVLRYELDEPFVQDGFLYFTDAQIIARVPASGQPDSEKRIPKSCGELFKGRNDEGKWKPLPAKLTVQRITDPFSCDICHGADDFFCRSKNGKKIAVHCPACNDVEREWFNAAKIDERWVAIYYLRLLDRLPGIEFLQEQEPDADKWLFFRATDNCVQIEGILMPIDTSK
jgi:hypothetical protein